jgi:hypothetical protein
VLIRVLVRFRIAGVVHAGPEVRVVEVFVLVRETEGVPNLLTHDKVLPRRRVVGRRVEVAVVHLGRALRDVDSPCDPDLRDTQPTVKPVRGVADLNAPRLRLAGAGVRGAGDVHRVENY